MKYAITDNKRVIPLDELVAEEMSSYINVGAKTKPLITWPHFDETTLFFTIGNQVIALDSGFGLLLGQYIGDGWCDKTVSNPGMHIASISQDIIESYKNGVNKYLRNVDAIGYATGNKEHDYYPEYVSTHGKYSITIPRSVRDDMLLHFGHGAYNKHIPHELMSGPRDFRWGLLSGLIDTDGTVSTHSMVKHNKMQQSKAVMYGTQSWRLAQDVQLLCMSLGIGASITMVYRKERYELTVVISSIDIYNNRHNLICASDKAKRLDEFTFGDYPNPKDILPYDDELHAAMLEHNGYDYGGVINNNARRNGYIVRETFYQYAPPHVVAMMEDKYNVNTRWERIIAMIHMPDGHTETELLHKVKEVNKNAKKAA